MRINIQSNAKINLGLKIEGRRKDGYHNISTFMQEINLCDEIETDGEIKCSCPCKIDIKRR